MLPEYIPMRVAESILFAGKAVRVLRNPSPAFRYQDAEYHQHKPRGSQKLQGFVERFSFQKEPSLDKKIGEELLPQIEADKIEAMLQDLKVSFVGHTHGLDIVLCNTFWDRCQYDMLFSIYCMHLFLYFTCDRCSCSYHTIACKQDPWWTMCRNRLSSTKDHLSVLWTQFGLLLPVIFGRC